MKLLVKMFLAISLIFQSMSVFAYMDIVAGVEKNTDTDDQWKDGSNGTAPQFDEFLKHNKIVFEKNWSYAKGMYFYSVGGYPYRGCLSFYLLKWGKGGRDLFFKNESTAKEFVEKFESYAVTPADFFAGNWAYRRIPVVAYLTDRAKDVNAPDYTKVAFYAMDNPWGKKGEECYYRDYRPDMYIFPSGTN